MPARTQPLSHFALMQSLNDLATQLGRDKWDEERAVVDAVYSDLQAGRPSFLTAVTSVWTEPYLKLEFTHDDGTVFKVTHGDGYTEVVGGGVHYRGYLDTSSLIDVLVGALHGQVNYLRHSRFGYVVADYFEVIGREGERLGHGQGLAGVARVVLRSVPMVPESVRRTRVNFDSTPAITVD